MSTDRSIIRQLLPTSGRWQVDGHPIAFWALDDAGNVIVGAVVEGRLQLKLVTDDMRLMRGLGRPFIPQVDCVDASEVSE